MTPDSDSDWRPTASLATLKLRAQMIARIRDFFARRDVLEVETPILSAAGTTDPNIHSFATHSLAPGDRAALRYLHTSPEFAMKRLVAASIGSIYQICKVFRGGETGRWHNPEFTLLEWYRVGFDYHQLMDEVVLLATEALVRYRALDVPEKFSYRDAFLQHAGIDPHTATAADFASAAKSRGIQVSGLSNEDRDAWRDLLLTHLVEPHLGRGRLACLYDYPASQAALARVRPGDPPLAERFEVYLEGIELANGFQELTDADEQRARFERDRRERAQRRLSDVRYDEHLLAALAHGLPVCSGVALGLDRLVMLAAAATSINDVIAFPADRS
jgi:lysyl-tRNA synthetase class 2